MKKRKVRTAKKHISRLEKKEMFEHFAFVFIISLLIIASASAIVSSQSVFSTMQTASLQEFLQSDLTVFVIWFSIFFSLIFFASRQIFGAETGISAVFSIAVSILTTVGLLKTYPDIMNSIGPLALLFLVLAIILLIYSLAKKSGISAGGIGNLKPTLLMIAVAYLIFWVFYKFTTVFPESFRYALYPIKDLLDILALVDLAILIILGLMGLSSKVSLKGTAANTAQQSNDADNESKKKINDMKEVVETMPPGPEKQQAEKIIPEVVEEVKEVMETKRKILGGFHGAMDERRLGDVEMRRKRYEDLIRQAEEDVRTGKRNPRFLEDLKKRMQREIDSIEREKKGLLLNAQNEIHEGQRTIEDLNKKEAAIVDDAQKKVEDLAEKSKENLQNKLDELMAKRNALLKENEGLEKERKENGSEIEELEKEKKERGLYKGVWREKGYNQFIREWDNALDRQSELSKKIKDNERRIYADINQEIKELEYRLKQL